MGGVEQLEGLHASQAAGHKVHVCMGLSVGAAAAADLCKLAQITSQITIGL
jgi:hypothetical protein